MKLNAIGRCWERLYPKLAALTVGGVVLWRPEVILGSRDFDGLLQATINVASIALGFLVAAKGIIISSEDRPFMKKLKELDKLLPLMDYFIEATFWAMSLCIASALLLLIEFNTVRALETTIAIWAALLSGSFFASVRVILLFNSILRHMAKNYP